MPVDAKKLDIANTLKLIQPGGALSQHLKGFEARGQQQEMMSSILEAHRDKAIALIEAGTGIGKSVAYLVPAILWAAIYGERTVISTNTINLQEQLIEKDIPTLIKALGVEVKAALVKGMGNYVCLRKFEDALGEIPLLPTAEAEELKNLERWRGCAVEGSLSELPIVPSTATWERIGAEHDTCTNRKCQFFEQCYFFNARKKSQDAQILVVNHHLLFSDLKRRADDENYDEVSVLPPYQHVIIDEAHNIEDIATDYFSGHISHWEVIRLMGRLSADRHGKLSALKGRINDILLKEKGPVSPAFRELNSRLELDLPGQRRDVVQQFADLFESLSEFAYRLKGREDEEEQNSREAKIRLIPPLMQHPDWLGEIQPAVRRLMQTGRSYCTTLEGLEHQLKAINHRKIDEQTSGLRTDIQALTSRLLRMTMTLEAIALQPCGADKVRWIEAYPMRGIKNVHLVEAELSVAPLLAAHLFNKFKTIVLCSATLTTNNDFTYIRRRLGLQPALLGTRSVRERIYESPFNYREQALFAVPIDLPEPTHPDFTDAATEKIWDAVCASRGNALVLFTSYKMLQRCHRSLQQRFSDKRYPLLKQGDESRKVLVAKMRAQNHSVLFATYSFWEGVDIAGDALRCVIIVKLPFKVPTEPILQARAEALQANGGNPFMDMAVPLAAVKFKQGCGRLIRNSRDRGCIICLDTRISTRPYGQYFLNSLPPCTRVFDTSANIMTKMGDFYRKTQYLVRTS